jgi:hypothetical protein
LGEQAVKYSTKQEYCPQTNVLSTRFLSDDWVGQIIDYMPLPDKDAFCSESTLPWVVRHIQAIRGTIDFKIQCFPGMNHHDDII